MSVTRRESGTDAGRQVSGVIRPYTDSTRLQGTGYQLGWWGLEPAKRVYGMAKFDRKPDYDWTMIHTRLFEIMSTLHKNMFHLLLCYCWNIRPGNRLLFIFHQNERAEKSLRKHAYSNILTILPPKNENFQMKNSDIFLISAQNIDCGCSLEPPRRGGSNEFPQSRRGSSNEYPQSMF